MYTFARIINTTFYEKDKIAFYSIKNIAHKLSHADGFGRGGIFPRRGDRSS